MVVLNSWDKRFADAIENLIENDNNILNQLAIRMDAIVSEMKWKLERR